MKTRTFRTLSTAALLFTGLAGLPATAVAGPPAPTLLQASHDSEARQQLRDEIALASIREAAIGIARNGNLALKSIVGELPYRIASIEASVVPVHFVTERSEPLLQEF